MRIFHLADLHIKFSGPRAGECRRILEWIPEHVPEIEPDAIVISGDIFDRRSLPEERLFLLDFLIKLEEKAESLVFLINGNHDDPEDVQLFDSWRGSIEVITHPEIRTFKDLTLAFLPWPQLAILAATAPDVSIADRKEVARAALLDILRGFEIPGGAPSLLVAHMPVLGASMDSGQPVSGGEEIALSTNDLLTCGAAGIALGHIHLRQQMRSGDRRGEIILGGRPVWYAGAPFRTTFGEASGSKGGLIWDWIDSAWRVTPWDAPARPMVLLEGKWIDGQLTGLEHGPLDDAEVRLRIEFPSEEREAARIRAEELKKAIEAEGAHSVTIDERPVIVTRSRCVEIAAARTTIEKLNAWAQAAGSEIPEDAEAKLQILEAGVSS